MTTYKRIITKVAVILGLVAPMYIPATASALFDTAKQQASCGAALEENTTNCDNKSDVKVGSTIESVINILSYVVGIIAVIMLIIGGIKFVTSQGDSSSTNSARNTVIYAVVGIIVVVLAQAIVRFVITRTK